MLHVSRFLGILRSEFQALEKRSSFREAWPTRWRAAADCAVALAVVAVEIGNVAGATGATGAPLVLAVLAGASLVARRVAPLTVLLWTGAAAITIQATGSEGAGWGVLVALYTVTVVYDRWISLLVGLAPVLTFSAIFTAANADPSKRVLLVPVVICVTCGTWAAGTYVQMQHKYLHTLEERAADAERERDQLTRLAVHEERAAIARELHDIVAHSVGVMLVGVRGARDVLRTSPDRAEETLARVETSGEESLTELRRILALLRVSGNGAGSRPQPSLAQLEELVTGYAVAGMPVRLEIVGRPVPLPGGVQLSVYRIVEEALTNVLKHSRPSEVTVTLTYQPQKLDVEILDDGTYNERSETRTPGHGLVGMRERVELLRGEFNAGRRVGGGFRVVARLPIEPQP